jgi:2-polyprenyl-3-methyl-5-hydroxy-6-metoxy-1,4-benzoquinol methylase
VSDFVGGRPSQYSSGIGVIPYPLCAVCGAEGKQLYSAMVDWLFGVPGNWGMRCCSACAIVWLDPRPTPNDIPKLYSRYYTHDLNPSMNRLGRLWHATSQFVLAQLGYSVDRPKGIAPFLLSHVRSVARAAALDVLALAASEIGTLLDVGCGNGQFIARMRSLGWRVAGVDPDPAAVAHGRRQGLEIFRGEISDVPDTTRYDVITLNHVVEHVADPTDLLRQCRNRLRPDTGRLIITTPNINSLGHWWFKDYWRGLEVPRHFILFSPAALRGCVTRAGLRLHSLRTETRLARMIYSPSTCAKAGSRDVGEWINFKTSTKVASYLFQVLEDSVMHLNKDVGEEIFCVCGASAEV